MPPDSTEELDFARAMLADPHNADRRLFYADWLEEAGAVERAALVREAEGWSTTVKRTDYSRRCEFRAERRWRCTVRWTFNPGATTPLIECSRSDPFVVFSIRPDGSSPDDPDNWAWMLALAISRGLIVPALGIAPTTPETHHAPRLD